MTRPMRNPGQPMVKLRNEISVPVNSQLYAFCSRMKQTPIRSMLMAHGCCFDFFEKGICKAGNDCKYSHLKPGDERNLIMDSEVGLRRKKYYRPETLETYRPGSQDVICFTFARKGWCIHGDKCWNQHISPPSDLLGELGPNRFNGLPISNTPSPDQDDMPTLLDTGYGSGFGLTQPLAHLHSLTHTPSPVALTNPHWSASTLAPMRAGQQSGGYSGQIYGNHNDYGKQKVSNNHFTSALNQGKVAHFCHPDPKRTDAPNWRIPNTAVAASTPSPVQAPPVFKPTAPILKTTSASVSKVIPAPIAKPIVKTSPVQLTQSSPVTTVQPQPIRSALNEFNWRPVIQEETGWRKNADNNKSETAVGGFRPSLPALQIPTHSGAYHFGTGNTGRTPVDYNYGLTDFSDDGNYDQHKYRIGAFGLGRIQSTVPSLLQ